LGEILVPTKRLDPRGSRKKGRRESALTTIAICVGRGGREGAGANIVLRPVIGFILYWFANISNASEMCLICISISSKLLHCLSNLMVGIDWSVGDYKDGSGDYKDGYGRLYE
jgi:hypothetical protein